ncbi:MULTISPECIES: DUF4145 domain-containing protein [Shewanella]|uniref:DUF4145 domain-containing protein n=1 Tax=Shewanella TaxID=22 RepID=UPI001C655763|nr:MULTISPECIES: DUF4145 domain-containing protein [Shewanella]QYJ94766.1 DUF4145 domain-containing protein [Shewanella spartinae]
MDIAVWKRISSFTALDSYPLLPCPHCNNVALQLDQDSIQLRPIKEDTLLVASRKYRDEKYTKQTSLKQKQDAIDESDGFWLPLLGTITTLYMDAIDPINGDPFLFNAFFTCNDCGEHVTASGVLLEPKKWADESTSKAKQIKVEHFSPTVPFFPLSANTPKLIGEELYNAFKHFHFDPLSSASKLRRAIERFCDDMLVEGSNLNRKVQNLAKTHPEEASYLEPLKLVGNEGTHGSNVDELDLLYGFQMFQFVLEMYDRNARFESLQETYDKLADKVGKERLQLAHKKELTILAQ